MNYEVTRIQGELGGTDFEALIDDAPDDLRVLVLVRHHIMIWLRTYAHKRIIGNLAAMTNWSGVTTDQRYTDTDALG